MAAWRAEHEPLVLEANGGGMRAIVVRPGIVYGGADGIISGMLREADNSIMRVIGTGENHWPMIYDRDLADLYVKLIAHPEASGVFHATDDGEERVIDLVKAMSRHVEFTPEIRYMPLPEARAKLGTYADALALDQIVRSPRAREIGWHADAEVRERATCRGSSRNGATAADEPSRRADDGHADRGGRGRRCLRRRPHGQCCRAVVAACRRRLG